MQTEIRTSRGGAATLPGAIALALAVALAGPGTAIAQDPAPAGGEQSERADAATPRIKPDASALAKAVAAAIERDTTWVEPASMSLRVSAKGGAVSLAGTAGTIYDREHSARVAEGTAGVRSIHPAITVKPSAAGDAAALGQAVEKAVRDANVAGEALGATASADGTVQLSGEVTNEWAAVNAVKRVPGVTAIGGYAARRSGLAPPGAEGELRITPPSPAQDTVIDGRVKDELKAAQIESIETKVEKGIVRLTGRAKSLGDLMRIYTLVRRVPGVLGVDNDKLTAPAPAYRVGVSRDSQVVEREVRRKLRSHGIENLTVHVNDGTVLIAGRASSDEAAYGAVEAASWVPGVKEVINALSYPAHVLGS